MISGAVHNSFVSKLWKSETNRLTLLNSIVVTAYGALRMSISGEVITDAPFGPDQLGREVNNAVGPHRPRGAVRPLSPLPDYVTHRNGVNEVGKLSAEAVGCLRQEDGGPLDR